jgi:hypothetical protein
MATNKENEIFESSVAQRKGAAYIAMNALKRASGVMHGLLRKWGSLYVSSGADQIRGVMGIVKIDAVNGFPKAFYTYMPHQAM